MIRDIIHAFFEGLKGQTLHKNCIHAEKELRENLDEKQIDKMIKDSFPASDPPSTY
jgi:hypothetical protein